MSTSPSGPKRFAITAVDKTDYTGMFRIVGGNEKIYLACKLPRYLIGFSLI